MVHHIHQGLLHRHITNACHVESVYVLPPWEIKHHWVFCAAPWDNFSCDSALYKKTELNWIVTLLPHFHCFSSTANTWFLFFIFLVSSGCKQLGYSWKMVSDLPTSWKGFSGNGKWTLCLLKVKPDFLPHISFYVKANSSLTLFTHPLSIMCNQTSLSCLKRGEQLEYLEELVAMNGSQTPPGAFVM